MAIRSTCVLLILCLAVPAARAELLPGTQPLTAGGDLAARMVAGMHRYLDRELAASAGRRGQLWKPDFSSAEAYTRSVEPNRRRLRHILGVVDARVPAPELRYVATTGSPALVAETPAYRAYAVRWPVLDGVDAEGLLLEPRGKPVAGVVALPDADWTPEVLAGLAPGAPFARRLAENGCRVLVPTLIDRRDTWSGNPAVRMTNEPHREFVYRMAYQQGRHIIGYEVEKVLAAVDWFARDPHHLPVGVVGYGEGGLLAFYAGAVDERIRATVVSGYFGPREAMWREPIYRNVWGLLHEFGDAEVAGRLFHSRTLLIEDGGRPHVPGPPPARAGRTGAAPGGLLPADHAANAAEARRAQAMEAEGGHATTIFYHADGHAVAGRDAILTRFLAALGIRGGLKPAGPPPTDRRPHFDPDARQRRAFDQLVRYTQKLVRESEARRQEFFWSRLDTASPERYRQSIRPLRASYAAEVIGELPPPTLPANARSRLAYDQPKWKGYEVMLDLYPDVIAEGLLLVPKDLAPGERRPVVVCQHGLEGTPRDVADPTVQSVYNAFAAQLADRGYVVYAPQNPYRGDNEFRQLQRKANPLKLTMFAFIVRQHERTLDWLAGLPFVDPARIGFYGLSYGGETAVRVPPLVERYALSICSGDFNHFPWKTTTLDFTGSYELVGTYEIFDFDMNNTFSHAEMAALIAPRPFMVERGHKDGVGLDEWVAYEYAKVRRLYTHLGLPDRTAIEFFPGGHEIHGRGTFAFLDRHLGPVRKER